MSEGGGSVVSEIEAKCSDNKNDKKKRRTCDVWKEEAKSSDKERAVQRE